MSHITPQMHLSKSGEKTQYKYFKSYRLLKKDISETLKEYDEIFVVRGKRGQWGEWFEYWRNVNGKPEITKQGWS